LSLIALLYEFELALSFDSDLLELLGISGMPLDLLAQHCHTPQCFFGYVEPLQERA
jgi:hypothetical protein